MNTPDPLPAWLVPFVWLAAEAALVVLAATAAQPLLRSAVARRSLWRAVFVALALLCAAEFTGLTSQATVQLRAALENLRPAPTPIPEPTPALIALPEPPPISQLPSPIPSEPEPFLAPEPLPFEPAPSLPPPPLPLSHSPTFPPALALLLAGTALLLARLIWTQAGFALLRHRHFTRAAAALEARVRELAARLGLHRPVRVLESLRLHAPAAFGWLRPTVGVPGDFTARFTPPQQDVMLAHELAHLAARDPLWHLAAELITAACWWHPLAWFARRQLRAASEQVADEASLTCAQGPVTLAECLLALGREAAAAPDAALGMAGLRSGLGRRVERLLALPPRDWHAPGRARLALQTTAALLALAAVALLPGCAANRAASEAPSRTVAKWWQAKTKTPENQPRGATLLIQPQPKPAIIQGRVRFNGTPPPERDIPIPLGLVKTVPLKPTLTMSISSVTTVTNGKTNTIHFETGIRFAVEQHRMMIALIRHLPHEQTRGRTVPNTPSLMLQEFCLRHGLRHNESTGPLVSYQDGQITFLGNKADSEKLAMLLGGLLRAPLETRNHRVAPDGGLADVLVYVKEGLPNLPFPAPTNTHSIRIQGYEYQPYITAVQTGQPIRWETDVNLNFHPTPTNPANREFNRVLDPGRPVEAKFTAPEFFLRTKDDVHPWLFGYVSILPHPYFAVTDAEGRFRFPQPLPPGKYTLAAVHRQAGTETHELVVDASFNATKPIAFSFGAVTGRDAILSKLAETRLPEVTYDGLPLPEVVKFLSFDTKKNDPERRGVHFALQTAKTNSPAAVDLETVLIKVTTVLRDVSVLEALDAILKTADARRPTDGQFAALEYRIETDRVVFQERTKPAASAPAALTPRQRALRERLEAVVLPSVQYDGLPLPEVIKMLEQDAKRHDPEKKGFNLLLSSTGQPGSAEQQVDLETVLIQHEAVRKNATVREVLDAICQTAEVKRPDGVPAGLKYSVEGFGILFTPDHSRTTNAKPAAPPVLVPPHAPLPAATPPTPAVPGTSRPINAALAREHCDRLEALVKTVRANPATTAQDYANVTDLIEQALTEYAAVLPPAAPELARLKKLLEETKSLAPKPKAEAAPPAPVAADVRRLTSSQPPPASQSLVTSAATIAPGDVLRLIVAEDDSYNAIYPVRRDGSITVKGVGRVAVGGKGLGDARVAVKALLEATQLRTATVTLTFETKIVATIPVTPPPFTLHFAGEFITPGPLVLPPDFKPTLLNAITRVGGITTNGDLARVKLLRVKSGQGNVEEFNVANLLADKARGDETPLQSGDIIMVPALAPVVKRAVAPNQPAPVAADVRRLATPQTPDPRPQTPPVGQSLVTSAATTLPAAKNWTPAQRAILQRLDAVVFPEIAYDGLPLPEVVKMLQQDARKFDPEKKGFNFLLNSAAQPLEAPARIDLNTVLIKVTSVFRGLTLAQVLDLVCKTASEPIQFTVEDYGIVFTQRDRAQPFVAPRLVERPAGVWSPAQRTLLQRLDTVVFPEITYDGLPLPEVVKFLEADGRKHDPEKRGFNFLLNSTGQPGDAATQVDLDVVLIHVTSVLRGLTLNQVLDVICKTADVRRPDGRSAGLQFVVEDYGIVFRPRDLAKPFVAPRLVEQPAGAAVRAKAEKIALPQVQYDGMPLTEIVKFLIVDARKFDPDSKGVNFLVTSHYPDLPPVERRVVPMLDGNGNPIPGTERPIVGPDLNFTVIRLGEVRRSQTLIQTLDAICAAASMPIAYRFEDFGVLLTPKLPEAYRHPYTPGALPADQPADRASQVLGVMPIRLLNALARELGRDVNQLSTNDTGLNGLLAEYLAPRGFATPPGQQPVFRFVNGRVHYSGLRSQAEDFARLLYKLERSVPAPPRPIPAKRPEPAKSPKPGASAPAPSPFAERGEKVAEGRLRGAATNAVAINPSPQPSPLAPQREREPDGVPAIAPVAADVRRLQSNAEPGTRKAESSQSLVTSAATDKVAAPDPLQAAQAEAVRRQVQREALERLLAEAKQFLRAKSWTNAAVRYEEAFTLAKGLGGGAVGKQSGEALAGLTHCRLQLAVALQEKHEFRAAAAEAGKVLAFHPTSTEVEQFNRFNERVEAAHRGRAARPLQPAERTEVMRLVRDGRLYHQTGEFAEAKLRLEQAVALDPVNEAAFYYLRLVSEAQFERESQTREKTYSERVVAVTQKWNEEARSKNGLPVPNPYFRTNAERPFLTHSSKGAQRINRKLEEVVLPEVHFDAVPLVGVVQRLIEDAKKFDPEPDPAKKGLNFLINDVAPAAPLLDAAGNPVPVARPVALSEGLVRVTQPLKNLTLRQALDVICKTAELPTQFSVEEYAIAFIPRGPVAYYSRMFRVNPDAFIQGLQGVVGNPVLGVTPGVGNAPGAAGQNQPTTTTGPVRAVVPAAVPATQRTAAEANALSGSSSKAPASPPSARRTAARA